MGEKLTYFYEPSYGIVSSTEGESAFSLGQVCFGWVLHNRNVVLLTVTVSSTETTFSVHIQDVYKCKEKKWIDNKPPDE